MQDHLDVFLGVDGGYSGTRALLIDAHGRVLGFGTGGNANHASSGYAGAIRNVATAVQQACVAAGIAYQRVRLTFLALAGDDVEDDHSRLTEEVERALPELHFVLRNDVWAGLRAGSVSGIGVAINCGSGTGVVGRNAQGLQIIIPDLGYLFGDSGGGGQIATDAFRAVIRAWDGRGEHTALLPLLLELTAQPTVDALYLALYRKQIDLRTFRAATPLVFQAAAEGDTVATGILRRIGGEQGNSGAAVARRLAMADEEFPFVLTGGVYRTLYSPLAEAAITRMQTTAPYCRPTLPLLLPVAGAALLALDVEKCPVTEKLYADLRAQGYGWHADERSV